jgi:hypothetical protein
MKSLKNVVKQIEFSFSSMKFQLILITYFFAQFFFIFGKKLFLIASQFDD